MEEKAAIICVSNGLVDSCEIVEGKENAELYFIAACREKIWNFDDYNSEIIERLIEQGYERFGQNSVCLCWL